MGALHDGSEAYLVGLFEAILSEILNKNKKNQMILFHYIVIVQKVQCSLARYVDQYQYYTVLRLKLV